MGFEFLVARSRVHYLLLLTFCSPLLAMHVDPSLLQILRANSRQTIGVLVHLEGQLELLEADKLRLAPSQRTKALVDLLEAHTKKSSAKLVKLLRSPGARGVVSIDYLWLTNSLKVVASAPVIEKLLAANGIESLMLDSPKQSAELFDAATGSLLSEADGVKTSWGVEKVNAPRLWEQGTNGTGVVVAMIDSGANLDHPDLKPSLWQNAGETGIDDSGNDRATNQIDDDQNGYVDDVVGWNFEDSTNSPIDEHGHGSQTAGVVAGAGIGGTKTGVAPGAKLMILRSCCNASFELFESNTWEAMQYAIKNGARVISMSLSAKHDSSPSYAKWRRASEVVLAAGVVHVNSAGNRGSDYVPHNIGAPASNPPPWFHPKQPSAGTPTSMITIGATDEEDILLEYSSTGPVTWEDIDGYKDFPYEQGKKDALIRPDVCGPSEVPSLSKYGSGYTSSFGGTSAATPNVAGVVALLLSAVPKLTVPQVLETLQMSALQVGSAFSNQCGAGRVDAVAAVAYAKAHF